MSLIDRLRPALSHRYRIEGEIGSGGMAVVYRAQDLKHDRTVAIKVLREGLAESGAERFLQEIRIVAKLQHPHILALLDSGQIDGTPFYVMPFVEGESLRDKLDREKELPVAEALRVLSEVADALAFAHQHGVVHRDIKPDNVLLSGRHALVADFGIAKALDAAQGMRAATTTGIAIGTPAYMAPEQATGRDTVDGRVDIYALGVLGYELLTGFPPFVGRTPQQIFGAKLSGHVTPASHLRPAVPEALSRVLLRCLEERPADRWQTAEELMEHLEPLRASSREVTPWGLEATQALTRWKRAAASLGVVVVGVVAWLVLRDGGAPTMSQGHGDAAYLPLRNAMRATTSVGLEESPVWSPDGRALAFQSDRANNWDIWVTQLGTGQAVNRTADSPGDDTNPTWSPDGEWIAFYSERDGGGYFVMPSIGGTPRKVVSGPAEGGYPTPAAWSPGGGEIAYARNHTNQPSIEILALSTGVSRRLSLPPRPRNNRVVDLSWSPDGRWLAYRRSISPTAGNAELWLTSVLDGKSVQLTDGSSRDLSPTWSPDSRQLCFVSDRRGSPDLWSVTIDSGGRPSGAPRQLTAGIEMRSATLSADGTRLAYTKGRRVRNVFRVPILRDRPALWSDVTQLTFEEANYESVDVSSDGRLLLSSDRSGNWDIWVMPAAGGALQQLTTDSALDAGPRWNADGTEVVFYSSRTGHREVWIMPQGSGPARQVTMGEGERWYPTWSPDGREIAAQTDHGIIVVPAGGGVERHLTQSGVLVDWSPDGRWLAYAAESEGAQRLWRVSTAGGEPERLTGREGSTPRWSPDGKEIFFIGPTESSAGLPPSRDDLWVLSLESRQDRQLSSLRGRRGELARNSIATDGEFLYFVWEESHADIWVADFLTPGD